MLPGSRALFEMHDRELPQRDDLCGAFCASLALHAAGIGDGSGRVLDQDAVAVAAGSIVSRRADPGALPSGEVGRRDYRLSLPLVEDSHLSGTTAAGLVAAVEELSEGRLAAIPYGGPWTAGTLRGLFDLASQLEHPVTLIANLATHHLWGSHPAAGQVLDHLFDGTEDGPEPDWRVGHFVCVAGRVSGPGGSLYTVLDTYPSLGNRGVHVQPEGRLAAGLERRDMPAGGMLVIVTAEDAPGVRSGAHALGLVEGAWDNGTVAQEMLR